MNRPVQGSPSGPPPKDIIVKFQYNPLSIDDNRRISYATLNAPGMLMPIRQYSAGGDRTISFTVTVDGLFAGPVEDSIAISRTPSGSIRPELDKYRAFVYPAHDQWESASSSKGGFAGLYRDVDQFRAPPSCRFAFGNRVVECLVTEVDIKELLFNGALEPLRAEIAISLVEVVPYHPSNAGRG